MTDLAMYSLDEEGVVIFGFRNIERVISGAEEALQLVAYHLFTTLGTNSFDRDEGGSIQNLARGNLKSEPEIQTEAMIAISRTMSKIRETQDTDKKPTRRSRACGCLGSVSTTPLPRSN